MRKTETITLPSGLSIEIREIGPAGLARAMEGIPVVGRRPGKPEVSTTSTAVEDVKFLIRLVCECSVEPKLTQENIDDVLGVKDFNPLGTACRRLCGFTEAAEEVDPSYDNESRS